MSPQKADGSLTPKPFMLFYHFFCVAFYSIWILFTQGLPPKAGTVQKKPGFGDVPGLTVLSVKVVSTQNKLGGS
jgi:squalene monooxygenase